MDLEDLYHVVGLLCLGPTIGQSTGYYPRIQLFFLLFISSLSSLRGALPCDACPKKTWFRRRRCMCVPMPPIRRWWLSLQCSSLRGVPSLLVPASGLPGVVALMISCAKKAQCSIQHLSTPGDSSSFASSPDCYCGGKALFRGSGERAQVVEGGGGKTIVEANGVSSQSQEGCVLFFTPQSPQVYLRTAPL
ncbi:hypothetical protein L218DRAFT_406854 [Marasmius fiardii PR-910]|nr:hypothetical protein L218DRAFT_406854 [Marasmius fiardii PR-910]